LSPKKSCTLGKVDSQQLAQICAAYKLGAPLAGARTVRGGLLHRMWRVTTTKGDFAVKELNPDIMRKSGARDEYRRSERIAAAMAAAGVPAVTARRAHGDSVWDLDGATVMVFDWVDGETMPWGAVSPEQGERVGAMLGRIHTCHPDAPGLSAPEWSMFEDTHWNLLVDQAMEQEAPWASALSVALPDLAAWSASYRAASAKLTRTLVVSHCDLDQKNVLWRDAVTPAIVDWEAAGLTNPALELAGAALDWSGQPAGPPLEATFVAVLEGYRRAGGVACDAGRDALHGVMGNWLNWLEFNTRRALGATAEGSDERALGVRETVRTLDILRRLAENLERWGGLLDAHNH